MLWSGSAETGSSGEELLTVLGLSYELSELLGVRVDVVTPTTLRSEGRDAALAEAVPLSSPRMICNDLQCNALQSDRSQQGGRMARGQLTARINQGVLERLARHSRRIGQTRSRLAERLIDEGLRIEEFPGIVFRSGPAGRRAALADGPDVWEIVRDLKRASAVRRDPVQTVLESTDLREDQLRLAATYYSAYPDEIDERIREEEGIAERLRQTLGATEAA